MFCVFFFKQKTAYGRRISDWSSDVCSSDLMGPLANPAHVTRQLIGIARPDYAPVYAEALEQLGTEAALVVSGEEGLDEVSGAGPTIAVSVGSLAMPPSIAPEDRSEEHTSELQSLMRISYAVFCLKKKKT